MKDLSNLVSGMMLVTKAYGDLHYLIATPFGYKVIDVDGCCIDLELHNYTKAYIPSSYDDIWTPLNNTEIIF
jgi:hypothetical protein